MPVKKFGIYLAYGPLTDFRNEGLGRLLAEFLKASLHFEGTKFVIAAPRWLERPLHDLFENFDLDIEEFEIISPKRPSVLETLYHLSTFISRGRRKLRRRIEGRGRLRKLKALVYGGARSTTFKVAKSRNPLVLIAALAFAILALPLVVFFGLITLAALFLRKAAAAMQIRKFAILLKRRLVRYSRLTHLTHNAYRLMCDAEAAAVAEEANKRADVEAWYAPASFWPEFNMIKARRLMCVPDVVPVHYSVAFAIEHPNGDRLMHDFKRIEAAIEGGDRFVTYSKDIKYRTLVDRFCVDPDRVDVIPHGANRLDHLVMVSGFADNEEASDVLSAPRLWFALAKSSNNAKATWYASKDLGFFFYASQIRPNKNVISLLRAYHHLRRTQNIPYKLIMTGDFRRSPDVRRFMEEYRLHDDVLFVRGLDEKELAACYRLATLCINPSLAEGGMPFTFTEGVSVGTPVIMSDIPVSREIICDEHVAARTFFDGFDYNDIARAIALALEDIEGLYAIQRSFYETHLMARSWHEVVGEYVAALERSSDRA